MAAYKSRFDHAKKDAEVEAMDLAQDKKVVKKAIAMHDEQEHKGEKTDLTKLRKGGRAKKEKGTVREMCGGGMAKYKEGGRIADLTKGKFEGKNKEDAIKKTPNISKNISKYKEGGRVSDLTKGKFEGKNKEDAIKKVC